MNLRESAKLCPRCMSCGLENPNGDLLCLAHSNALADGRGIGHKTPDIWGAIVCKQCHDWIDGRSGGFSLREKRARHKGAWVQTIRWWIEQGYVGEMNK